MSRRLVLAFSLMCGACGHTAPVAAPPPPAQVSSDVTETFGESTPEREGMDVEPLLALTDSVRDAKDFPVLSILVSRHGKLVYEMYTSHLGREEAHYMMSVTKSVVSTLVGIAIGEHLLPDANTSIAEVFPASLFPSPAARETFRPVTIRNVLGMSALDAPDPPRVHTPEALARFAKFVHAESRVRFALTQAVLPSPGVDFQYNDVTPMLATGFLHMATHATAFDYARTHLFEPMGFRNFEWMHQDRSSVDLGGSGLRLRPIDMQKLGVLFLRHGLWNGKQLVPRAWVDQAFVPWNQSPTAKAPNYGSFWWTKHFGSTTALVAVGWKGQRIAVFPAQDLVVTMTAVIEDADEEALFAKLMEKFVLPAVASETSLPPAPELRARLAAHLAQVKEGPLRFLATTEWRMIPTVEPKEVRRPYAPLE
jgi:CubicO group peptidase (beta-lactamase class C family)